METHRIEVGGLTLACRKAGEPTDPCLVLLHGWPQTGLAWEGVLPELGRDSYALERAYFDFFYDIMAADKRKLPDARRDAYATGYASREALKAGFDWYRAMPKDAEHNGQRKEILTRRFRRSCQARKTAAA